MLAAFDSYFILEFDGAKKLMLILKASHQLAVELN